MENNQKSILHAIHPKTKKKYWVFNGTDELNRLLDKWRLRKNS